MQSNSSTNNLYISDFHRLNSMAAQQEVLLMLLQPFSREQMLEQIMLIHSQTISKENVNAERRKSKSQELDIRNSGDLLERLA